MLAVLQQNVRTAQAMLRELLAFLPDPRESPATRALEHALITPPDHIPDEAKRKLSVLVSRLLAS
ncbi:MAG: hypothetical protein M5U28_27055 [Sandaracinaceae bacterium]|nr:hypothetical protein [Sandaracinaceae bacterium]